MPAQGLPARAESEEEILMSNTAPGSVSVICCKINQIYYTENEKCGDSQLNDEAVLEETDEWDFAFPEEIMEGKKH